MVVNSGARQEIEKDLRNGTLVDRYNKEVIQPRLEKTAETLRRLETEKEISESFTQTAEKPSPAVHNKKEPPKPGPRLEL
jgi:hypothetical protein